MRLIIGTLALTLVAALLVVADDDVSCKIDVECELLSAWECNMSESYGSYVNEEF